MAGRKKKTEKSKDTSKEPTFHEKMMVPLFSEALVKHGITEEYLAKKLKDELEATEPKFFQHKGTIEITAWKIRQVARKDAHELRGDYPAKRTEVGGVDGKDITVIVRHYSEDKTGGD